MVNMYESGMPGSRVVRGCDPKKAVDNKPDAARLVIRYRPNGRRSADTMTNALHVLHKRQHSAAEGGVGDRDDAF